MEERYDKIKTNCTHPDVLAIVLTSWPEIRMQRGHAPSSDYMTQVPA